MELTSLQKLPSLTEIFFGKGIDPATDKPYKKAAPKKEAVEKKVMSKKKLEQ
tara:strand:- start:545 stop:700 length:156 start_codon:yes stop_codon:yes gene_type:complete